MAEVMGHTACCLKGPVVCGEVVFLFEIHLLYPAGFRSVESWCVGDAWRRRLDAAPRYEVGL